MSGAGTFFSRLSPRERILTAAAAALACGLALVYGVLMPGIDARASAESRNARAIADLAEARELAAAARSEAPTQQNLDTLIASATSRGITVLDAQLVDGSAILRVTSSSSRDVLAWAADASTTAIPLRSLSIARDGTGSLAVDAAFSGSLS